MDKESLVDNQIEDGHRLLIELVREGFDVSCAAWVKSGEEGLWHLYIGSTSVDPGTLGDAYRKLYACLMRIPSAWVEMSEVKLLPASGPIAQALSNIRDQYPGGRLATRYGGKSLGDIAIEEAYIYPRVMPGLTRDEVIHAVTGLMNRSVIRPSMVTLRNGRVLQGIPYGLEVNSKAGQPAILEIKFRDATDGSTCLIPADEVTNIQ